MKLLVDINLSPGWVAVLEQAGWETVHWSGVGNPHAADSEIMTGQNKMGALSLRTIWIPERCSR